MGGCTLTESMNTYFKVVCGDRSEKLYNPEDLTIASVHRGIVKIQQCEVDLYLNELDCDFRRDSRIYAISQDRYEAILLIKILQE